MADKAAAKLSGWRGRHLTQAGRVTLTKSVLSSQPVYLLTALSTTKKVLQSVDKLRKKFLWAGDDVLTGGKCKVNWQTVNRPLNLGGAGVLDLEKFARALRLRWLWQEWATPDKPWVGMGTLCNETDKLLFAASTTLVIGDGTKISFWNSAWEGGCRPCDLAPDVFVISKPKNRSLKEALNGHMWIRDLNLQGHVTVRLLEQFVTVWEFAQNVQLDECALDKIIWRWTASGEYSTSSAYRAQYFGSVKSELKPLIWKPWAPQKCKFFAWLVIKNSVDL